MGNPRGRPRLYETPEAKRAAQARANLKWRQGHKGQWKLIQRNAYLRRKGTLGDKLPPLEEKVVVLAKKEVVELTYRPMEEVEADAGVMAERAGYAARSAKVRRELVLPKEPPFEPVRHTVEEDRVEAELARFSAKRAARERLNGSRVIVEGFE